MKGQIVIPAQLRAELKIKPGVPIAIQREGTRIVLQPVTDEFIASIPGKLKRLGCSGSLSEALLEERRKDFEREERRLGRNK